MNKAEENKKHFMEKFYNPANEALLKEKADYKFLHRKDHCWWCGKQFEKDETLVTHGIFNYLGIYFCDNNRCLGILLTAIICNIKK